MLCRALSVDSSRILGPCLAVIVVLSVAFPAEGEDFRILLVRETGVDRTSRLPVGRIVISSGYIGGLEEGQIGTVWRKNKYKGQIEIADLEVVEADAYEATCRFTVRHPDFYVLKKDKAQLEPATHGEVDILARAIDALDHGRSFQALLYFESIYCSTRDNEFVQKQIQNCHSLVEERLTTVPSEDDRRKERSRIRDFLELAERHHKYHSDLAADLYLRRVLAVDSANTQAASLRALVPIADYSALLSPERCD